MTLDSLPDRPLELAELRDIDAGSSFRTVLPAAVFDLSEADYKLVPAVVFVTGEDSQVVAAGFDGEEGWTRVHAEAAAETEQGLEAQAREANRLLRDWAQKTRQAWAEPDGASTLLEYFDD